MAERVWDLDEQVMELPDAVQGKLLAIERELIERMEREVDSARRYAVRYATTGETRVGMRDYDGLFLSDKNQSEIVNAFRRDAGLPANPFQPRSFLAFWLFDRLRGPEFVTLSTLHREANEKTGTRSGKFQIEPLLAATLQGGWWALEKGKVDGRVAYRIVERDQAERTIGLGHFRVTCSRAGVLTVSPREGREGSVISVLPTGTNTALDELGESMKAQVIAWWKSVRP